MQDFARLIEALDPWLLNLVIVGGWAHRLYRSHALAQQLDYEPLFTLDTDIAVPQHLPVGEVSVLDSLRHHGFKEQFFGEHQPPITRYTLGSEDTGFYAEFLTPLKGSGYKRDGASESTVRVAGVSSQKLRYLEVLLEEPWNIRLDKSMGPFENDRKIQIANATSFIGQKLLVHEKRERKNRAKDVLYIHDTIEIFGQSLDALKAIWCDKLKPRVHRNVPRKIEDAISEAFSKVSDTIRDATEISRSLGRELAPDDIREVCHRGTSMIFM
jgi:hypothetical protein